MEFDLGATKNIPENQPIPGLHVAHITIVQAWHHLIPMSKTQDFEIRGLLVIKFKFLDLPSTTNELSMLVPVLSITASRIINSVVSKLLMIKNNILHVVGYLCFLCQPHIFLCYFFWYILYMHPVNIDLHCLDFALAIWSIHSKTTIVENLKKFFFRQNKT